jgi:hypothetical protein
VAFDNNNPPVENGRVAALVALMARRAADASGAGTARVGMQPLAPVEDHRKADRDEGPPAGAPPTGASPADGASGKKSIFKPKASDPARMKVATQPAAPNASAIANHHDYGLTWPQDIVYDVTARLLGDEWIPVIKSMTGRYSRQVNLVTGLNGVPQQDIPNAGVATQANFQNLLDALQNCGDPAHLYSHYSLAAVQAHENEHANRLRVALEDVEAKIKKLFEAIILPAAIGEDEVGATMRLKRDDRYDDAVFSAFKLWDGRFSEIIEHDHDVGGPCEVAERRVTTPLFEAIQQRAIEQGWIPTPAQRTGAGFAPPGTVSGVAASIRKPPQPAAAPKPPLNLPPKATWPPPKQ